MKGLNIATLDRRARALADLGSCAMYRQSLRRLLASAKRANWSAGLIDHNVRQARAFGWIIEHIVGRMGCHPSRLARRRDLWFLSQCPRNYYPGDESGRRRVNLRRLGPETLRLTEFATHILFGKSLEQYARDLARTGRPLVYKELDALVRVGWRAERDACISLNEPLSDERIVGGSGGGG